MIEIIWGDLAEAIAALRAHAPTLVLADPNWTYQNTGGTSRRFRGTSRGMYGEMGMPEIVAALDQAWEVAAPDAYLCLWATSPLLAEIFSAMAGTRWRYLTAGVWHKVRSQIGVGFHVRSEVEPWPLFAKGAPKPTVRRLLSYQAGPVADRTEKPVEVLSEIIRCLTAPGDVIGSFWTGRAPELRAAAALGRSAIGAEIDRWAWAQAVLRLEAAGAPPAPMEPWLWLWAERTLAGNRVLLPQQAETLGPGGLAELERRGAVVRLENGRIGLVRCPPRWARPDKEDC